MYHSITFGEGAIYPAGHEQEGQFYGTNTWDDWHLIPSERPSIASPGVSTNFVEIPGRDGAIDMSEFIMGRPVYGNRSGTLDFYVDNGHEHWETIRMKIINFLHGKKIKMVLEDDPGWYWEGRFAFNSWKSEAANSRVSINYQVGPYKYRTSQDGRTDTIWDTFNFETDYDYYMILNGIELTNGETKTVSFQLESGGIPIFIETTITSGNTISVYLNGDNTNTFTFDSSTERHIGWAVNGMNTVTLTGTGEATVYFTRRSL